MMYIEIRNGETRPDVAMNLIYLPYRKISQQYPDIPKARE